MKKFIKKIIPWLDEETKIYNLYKKSHKLIRKNRRFLAFYYRYRILKKYNCILSPNSEIGDNLKLPHPMGIVIGFDAKIGRNCTIYHQVTVGQKEGKFPIIGNNVTIYAGAKIIGNIKIGNNSIIGANAVVIKDVPENSIAVGVPARIIKKDEK